VIGLLDKGCDGARRGKEGEGRRTEKCGRERSGWVSEDKGREGKVFSLLRHIY